MRNLAILLPLLVIVAVVGIAVIIHFATEVPTHSESRIVMDTFVEISVWGSGRIDPSEAVDSAFALITRVDSIFGDGLLDYEEIAAAGGPELQSIVEVSGEAFDLTDGLFDPTIGSVTRLWEFYEGSAPPEPDSIRAALAWVGFSRYVAGDLGRRIFLDVGGVAKGYALDLAADRLVRLGFRSAILNAGGDIRLVGRRPDGDPWRVAVRHPREKGAYIGCLEVEDVSIATSGDYERYFFRDGRRFHHLLDPRTGSPSDASVSVTVIAKKAALGDALATGFFVMGARRSIPVIEALENVDAIFIGTDGLNIDMTSGAREFFVEVESQ